MSIYKKLSHREHVLLRPDSYVGSLVTDKKEMYVVKDCDLNNIIIDKQEINYNPAFIKLFDEIIVNASDHYIRTGTVKYIKVYINDDNIVVENDGTGIPIEIHPTEKIYNPELIFGHLLTGENYDDTKENRIVGGKNGFGQKLTNIFSNKFIVECADGKNKYVQEFSENMSIIHKPKITKTNKSYTKVIYYPELSRFNMNNIDNDSISLIMKRCIDVAAYSPKLKVYVNDILIPIKSVKDYMKLHFNDCDFFYEKLDNDWEVGVVKSNGSTFEQISIVNGITTYRGGTHVTYIANNLAKDISDSFSKKIKADWKDVKEKLCIFLICKIPNPDFDTQTKENMIKYLSVDIHQNCKISDTTIKKIMKSDIVQSILDVISIKEKLALKKLQQNNKKLKIKKLIDAQSKDRKNTQLFIFEGDSAGDAAINCRDSQKQGIFKLRGKIDNVRKMSDKNILLSDNINNLMNTLGITLNSPVVDSELRYEEILIATDMDTDGDAILCLLLNIFSKWKVLFDKKMIYRILTPLLVIKNDKKRKYFYTSTEWENYQKNNSTKGWDIEYKKGLGSLENDEYEELIKNPKKILISWDDVAESNLNIWFGEDSDLRKTQLV